MSGITASKDFVALRKHNKEVTKLKLQKTFNSLVPIKAIKYLDKLEELINDNNINALVYSQLSAFR